ncbi:hypothetical protein [Nocardia sp. NPDC059239]|uniref:hypothetical protein n=1 Tax=unclassified Nocardia TaxID=2637762 RepID=UPI0036AEEEF8
MRVFTASMKSPMKCGIMGLSSFVENSEQITVTSRFVPEPPTVLITYSLPETGRMAIKSIPAGIVREMPWKGTKFAAGPHLSPLTACLL